MRRLISSTIIFSVSLIAAQRGGAETLPDPGDLTDYSGEQCAIFDFEVTGSTSGGGVWGTDDYTDDSNLATAAVHAGVLSAGQTGVVRVQIVPGSPSYIGSSRNGVTSLDYDEWWPYSYAFIEGQIEVDAGIDQSVDPGSTVELLGTATQPDLTGYEISWRQLSGPSIKLSDGSVLNPTFVAPKDIPLNGSEVVELELSAGGCVKDTVSITVLGLTNADPIANAGPDQTVDPAASVTLDGSLSSDADRDPLTYSWVQSGGYSVTLSDPTAEQPTFAAPALNIGDNDVTLTFDLTVADGTVTSTVDQVNIKVQAPTATPPDAPTDLVATAGDGYVSLAFAPPLKTGGSAITDYEYKLNADSWVSAGTTESPVVITGLTNGTSYSIVLRAVNAAGEGAASASVLVNTPSPASEFTANEAEIRQAIVDEAGRGLQSTITANRRLIRGARDRLITGQTDEDTGTEPGNVPLNVDGGLDVNGATISSKGTFNGAHSLVDGTKRLVSGDFDVQADGDIGSTTATLTGRMAWERMVSDRTLLGYFVGGELAHSNIAGAFTGNQNRAGVTVGGYAVYELTENTYVDGFVTLGAGRNNLEMANEVITLESDYTTRSMTFGGALSSFIEQSGYEIWPELSFSYGRTWIGDVGFTGRAYGLVDNTLSLGAGSVSLANIMFRPEFRVPFGELSSTDGLQMFTFAPRLICEQLKATVTEENCGGGAEVGYTGQSADGMSNYSVEVIFDRLGNRTSSVLQLNLEHRF